MLSCSVVFFGALAIVALIVAIDASSRASKARREGESLRTALDALGKLVADRHSAFVELSAHPILLPAIQQELQYLGREGAVLPSLRREEDEQATMLESLGALHALGAEVDWRALFPAGGRCLRSSTAAR